MNKSNERINGNWEGVPWALFLIFIGIIFLLNNFGVLPWDVWGKLWSLWPLLLILVGLNIVFGKSRNGSMIVSFLFVFVIAPFIFLILVSDNNSVQEWFKRELNINLPSVEVPSSKKVEKIDTISVDDYEDIKYRNLSIDSGIGSVTLTDNKNLDDYLIVSSSYAEGQGIPSVTTSENGSDLSISFKSDFESVPINTLISNNYEYEFELGQTNIQTDLTIDLGVGSADVNFNSLNIRNLYAKTGTGSINIDLDEDVLPESIQLESGVGSIDIKLAEEIGLIVNYEAGIGSVNIDGESLRGNGSIDESKSTKSFKHFIRISVKTGTGSIDISR